MSSGNLPAENELRKLRYPSGGTFRLAAGSLVGNFSQLTKKSLETQQHQFPIQETIVASARSEKF
jgi:hypothetical protein